MSNENTMREALHQIALLLPPTIPAPANPRNLGGPVGESIQDRLYKAVEIARTAAPDFLESLGASRDLA